MREFLGIEDFVELLGVGCEDAIVQFLLNIGITMDDFEYAGKCDFKCLQCEAEIFSVWRRNIGFIKDKEIITFDLDAADVTFNFAIYWCNNCGKWTTYIG